MTNFEKSLNSGKNKFITVIGFDYVLFLTSVYFFVYLSCRCLHFRFELDIAI